MCWVNIIISIVIAIIGEAIRPKAKSNTGKPAGLGDFQFPTAEAGRVIPWIAGTVKILGPNTTASGLFRSEESYIRVKSGWWTTTKQSYGFRYYLSIQQVFCGGRIDDVVGFQVNDKFLLVGSKTVTDDYIDVNIADPAFYGDAKKDGGFAGVIRVYRGTPTQMPDDVLKQVLDQDEISAYRYVCHAVFRNFYFSMSNNPPPIVPIISRWPNTLGISDGRHLINVTASNIICAVYDLMTDMIRGMKIPSAGMDTAAFMAAAVTCYNEGIGYCGNIDGSQNGKDAVDAMMAYADGQVFKDPFTGLWTVKLARADYVVADLIVLDESNSRVTSRTKTDWPDTKNTFIVGFVDKEKNWTNQSVQAVDSGNLEVLGQTINAMTQDLNGIDNVTQAQIAAERMRAAFSTPFTKLEIEAQGIGSQLRINDAFVGRYPTTKRIEQMVLRVTDIAYPNNDETTCNIQAIEDKFGVRFVAFSEAGGQTWVPPSNVPLPAALQRVDEIPWAMTPNMDGNRYVMTAAARAGVVEDGYDVVNETLGAITNTVSSLTSAGAFVNGLAIDGPTSAENQVDGLVIGSVIGAVNVESALNSEYLIGASLLFAGDELIAFQNATDNGDGTFTLWPWSRAVYDTIPREHAAGESVFLLSTGVGLAQDTPILVDGDIDYKLLMRSGGKSASEATTLSVTLASRAQRPYLPGRVTLNGAAIQTVSSSSTFSGTISLAWASRNRLEAGTQIVDYSSTSVLPEDVSYYGLRFFDDATDTLLAEKQDLSGTDTTAEFNFTGQVRMEFYAKTAELDSYYKYEVVFGYSPADATSNEVNGSTYTPIEIVFDGGRVTA